MARDAEFILEARKNRIDHVLARRTRTITVVLESLEDPFNMAAVLRSCEAFGIQDVHVIRHPKLGFSPNRKVTQGCHKWLDVARYDDFPSCAAALHARGYRILATAVGERAESLFTLRFDTPLALVFGNERFGVSPESLARCDGTFWIPLQGFAQSLNVSAAAAATLAHAVAWRLEHMGTHGDLDEASRAQLQARFESLSVKQHRRLRRAAQRSTEC